MSHVGGERAKADKELWGQKLTASRVRTRRGSCERGEIRECGAWKQALQCQGGGGSRLIQPGKEGTFYVVWQVGGHWQR